MVDVTAVPQSSAKREEYNRKLAALAKSREETLTKRIADNEKYAKITTEKLLREYKEYRDAEERKKISVDSFYVPAEPQFFVAIQIRSQQKMRPAPKKVLELLRLKKINSAVIIRNNESIRNMLQKAKDYIAYGFLDYEMLRKLVYTRGFAKVGRSKVRLTNEVIEEAFGGKYRCIEELVHQIYFGCEDIKSILNFLWPFNLSCPVGGFSRKNKAMSFLEGGSTNNHKELLGVLLAKML